MKYFQEKTLQLEFLVFLVVFGGDGEGAGTVVAAVAGTGAFMGVTFVMIAVGIDLGAANGGDDVDVKTFEIVTGEWVTCFTFGTTFITLRTVIFRFRTFP